MYMFIAMTLQQAAISKISDKGFAFVIVYQKMKNET